ncbi:MAG: hypothetical protein JSV58_01910, partial [Candidatus Bathyarchaeota archaeon]
MEDVPAFNGGGSWTTWDENATRALNFLASMGCNLTYGLESGLARDDPQNYLTEYRRRLDIAESYGLKVHARLGSYRELTEEGADLEYFKTVFLPVVLEGLKNDSRITCVDIDVRPNLADQYNLQFIEDVSTITRKYDSNHPLSIGGWHYGEDWHNPEHLPMILESIDWIGLHMYPPDGKGDGQLPTELSAEEVRDQTYRAYTSQIQSCRAWGKPVIVTEYGINFDLLKHSHPDEERKMGFFWCWGAFDAFQDNNIPYKIFFQLGDSPDEAFSIMSSREGRRTVQHEIAARYLPKQIVRAPSISPPLENSMPRISTESLPLLRGFGEDPQGYGNYSDPLDSWDEYLTFLREEFGPNVNHVRIALTTCANIRAHQTFLDFE